MVFQQNGSGENKIKGIRQFGRDRFVIETYDIDAPLPGLIENSNGYLPETIDADIVLDYLQHPDLSKMVELLKSLYYGALPAVQPGKQQSKRSEFELKRHLYISASKHSTIVRPIPLVGM